MLPNFLVPEVVAQKDGASEVFELGSSQGKMLQLTLGITRVIEQESLELTVWGSTDNETWGTKPFASFSQKFYCGVYTIMVDLSDRPDVKSVQLKWKLGRWGRGEPKPLFGFYVFAEESPAHAMAAS